MHVKLVSQVDFQKMEVNRGMKNRNGDGYERQETGMSAAGEIDEGTGYEIIKVGW